MGRLLSTKNLALPGANGYVLKGNTDGTQEWAASSGVSSGFLFAMSIAL